MKFSDYKYQRPDLDALKDKLENDLKVIGSDVSFEEELEAINRLFKVFDEIETQMVLVSIRNSVDTTDKFYEEEQAFFDENGPVISQYSHTFNDKLLNSKNRKALEEKFGDLIFKRGDLARKTFKPEIIRDLQKENKLSTEYSKLIASAKIEFDGGTYNLSQMAPFVQSKDRDIRHRAQLAVSKFFEDNEAQLDRIYDDMVHVRTDIAKKLGYENFVQLGYDRFGRTDYDAKDVAGYREQIYKEVVPVVNELTKRKAKRLGIKEPKSYDLALSFLSGNPTPKGDRDWMMERAIKMYHEMSEPTGKFIDFMVERELLDLDAKPGKQGGGYCTYIANYDSPFIFANFNGTSHDVDVLTHEAGHAFQIFSSRGHIPEYRWPTMEAAEIHSMSMEFLAWPWVDQFFEEDTPKYKFNHLAGSLSFLPYGVTVDEFQHGIYENPDMTPAERKTLWRNIEKKYLPFKDYDDDKFLDKGTYWFRQGHIFGAPFYYIDYTLAQVCAFQFWVKSQEDHKKAVTDYIALCKLGGSKSFVDLVKSANLKNPFKPGTVKEIIKPINQYLSHVDDTKL
ncbi:M3 family oligoendopeptidase [Mycoplasmatota bacterium]|nr:M3 family oligoendopeptidase [Mycoplasmatota bacterium]